MLVCPSARRPHCSTWASPFAAPGVRVGPFAPPPVVFAVPCPVVLKIHSDQTVGTLHVHADTPQSTARLLAPQGAAFPNMPGLTTFSKVDLSNLELDEDVSNSPIDPLNGSPDGYEHDFDDEDDEFYDDYDDHDDYGYRGRR